MTTSLDTVIVGNGAAAAEAVLALRASGHRGRVDLFAEGALPPYNPMLGTYYASGALARAACFPFGDLGFYRRNGVTTHLGAAVERLEPGERALTTAGGARFSYRQCLLATGAATAVPPVTGFSGPGVHVLRTFADAVRLRGAVTAARVTAAARGGRPRALVLGASLAGLEIARVLLRAGLGVALVEREPAVLPRLAHPACAKAVERHLRDLGVDLRLGTVVGAVSRAGERATAVLAGAAPQPGRTRDDELTVDVIVVATGVRPALSLLAGDELAAGGFLDVDERLRTGAPGLFAAGDCARIRDPLSGARVTPGLWSSARRQGRAAGLAMAGAAPACPAAAPCAVQHAGDLLFAAAGSLAAADQVEIDERVGGVAVLGFSEGRLIGFNLLGDIGRAGPLLSMLGRSRPQRRIARAAVPRAAAPVSLATIREGMAWTPLSAG